MSEELPQSSSSDQHDNLSQVTTSVSGGVNINAQDVNVRGDVVGRDKIVQNINNISQHIIERPLTAEEQRELAHSIEARYLREGVTAFVQRLSDRAAEAADTTTDSPYRGLLEYRLSDAEIFYGRASAIQELLVCLRRNPLTVLHAESGAGKTSLLQAGISPYLIARDQLPVYVRPYNASPALAIKQALLPNLNETPRLAQGSLRDFLAKASGILGSQTGLHIYLDQFEEFFTQIDEAGRRAFYSDLAECLNDTSFNIHWIIALRAEYFSRLASVPSHIEFFKNQLYLDRLKRAEAREVIIKPVEPKGITFEPMLVEKLLDDLGGEVVQPPQLQLVCSALYEEAHKTQTRTITLPLYVNEGGTAGILHNYLNNVLKGLPADQRAIARNVLEDLITSQGNRARHTETELAASLVQRNRNTQSLPAILQQLIARRLISPVETDAGIEYELVHDYLAADIPLSEAVRTRKAAQELLNQEVQNYQEHQTLIGADKLAIIEACRKELVVDREAENLLEKSKRVLRRRQQRIVRWIAGVALIVVALVVIAVISSVTMIGAQTAAQSARAVQATAEAGAAMATTREAIANETLRRSFKATGQVPVGQNPSALAFDGTRLWVANTDDGKVQAIDPATGDTREYSVGNSPIALAFAGKRLWVANQADSTVQAINPATGDVDTTVLVGKKPSALAFDGTRLWVANTGDGTVQAIDPSTGDGEIPVKIGNSPIALAVAGGRLWAANQTDNTVQSIDTATGKVGNPISVGVTPSALAFDETRLWVACKGDNRVQAIDLATGTLNAPIEGVSGSPSALTVDGTRLWVAADSLQAIELDLLMAGPPNPNIGNHISALLFDGTKLWMANQGDNTVQWINPAISGMGLPTSSDQPPSSPPMAPQP